MNLPPEFFATELTATEFKVVVSLYHLSGPEWLVEATTDELGVLTGYSAESLRRAFRGLEKAGLLDTVRTKRNFGKWSKNRYQLVLPSHNTVDSEPEPSLVSVGWSEPPSHKSVGSTRSTTWLPAPAINYNNYKTSVIKNTTYSLRNTESVPLMKGVSANWNNPLPHLDGRITPGPASLALIVASALAIDSWVADEKNLAAKISAINRDIRNYISTNIPDSDLAPGGADHLISASFLYVNAEQLVTKLADRGYPVDSGSACSSINMQPSHVLAALGVLTQGNIRLTIHHATTFEEVKEFLEVLSQTISELRG
jgi:hypothetical protein